MGVVTAALASGEHCETAVGADGRFTMSVGPGVYQLTGHSPMFNEGSTGCDAERPVEVGPLPITYRGPPIVVSVVCQGF
jgi:hypothetical protein